MRFTRASSVSISRVGCCAVSQCQNTSASRFQVDSAGMSDALRVVMFVRLRERVYWIAVCVAAESLELRVDQRSFLVSSASGICCTSLLELGILASSFMNL